MEGKISFSKETPPSGDQIHPTALPASGHPTMVNATHGNTPRPVSSPLAPKAPNISSSQTPGLSPTSPTPASREPAIRTMKSDIERLFKTAPPSIAQMISSQGHSNPAVKKSTRIAGFYVALGIFVIIFLVLGGGAYYFWDSNFSPQSTIDTAKAIPPAPFFATENSRTLEVSQTNRQQFIKLMDDSMKEFERDGTIKRILIKFSDTPDQRFITMSDFLNEYHITPPENFLKRLTSGLMIFVYTSSGTRLGLATRTTDPTRTMRDMLDWEPRMLLDLKPLFFDQPLLPVTTVFEDRTYRNIDWRYFKLSSDKDIGIGYTIFPAGNTLIITTSRATMETVINRLFEAR